MRPSTLRTPARHALHAALLLPLVPLASASSHREAPFISELPRVDATDFYLFNSYEEGREDFVTVVANYQPLQDPYGGPNYFRMDPQARYDLHLDNDGDGVEDLTFRFRFVNRLRNLALPVGAPGQEKVVPVPLTNIGGITAADASNLNVVEQFSVELISGPVSNPLSVQQLFDAANNSPWFPKPTDNIGKKSFADYQSYADSHIHDVLLPGATPGRVFVGQRQDPFVVNLGETFDLINLDPVGAPDAKENSLKGKNVTSLILELPKSLVQGNGVGIVGGWTTASLPRTRVLNADPGFYDAETSPAQSPLAQVSRLGMPLVNEVVIGLPDKNRFNASVPADDAQFLDYVTHPTLPELIEALFGVTAPNAFPRADLIQVFLTGIPGLNENGSTAEMLRLNMGIAAVPRDQQLNLGVLAGDLAGFPNGRRPGDDVVDAALRVVMGVLLPDVDAPSGQLPYTDGATVNATDFQDKFPYLNTPFGGSPQ